MEATDRPGLAGRRATYIPPPPEFVKPLMEDLVKFSSRDDLPATIQAAVAHAQFETLHPFGDGRQAVRRAGGAARRRLVLGEPVDQQDRPHREQEDAGDHEREEAAHGVSIAPGAEGCVDARMVNSVGW